jgi:hypothetical protein
MQYVSLYVHMMWREGVQERAGVKEREREMYLKYREK